MVGARLELTIASDHLRAVAVQRGKISWVAEATYQDSADLSRVLAALAAERPRGVRRAAVTLAAEVARVKTLEGLPRLKREHLAAHVRLHSRRYFLQNGVPLVTDAMPISAGSGETPVALLAGAPVPLVEAIVNGLREAGLDCTGIVPAGTELSLLPNDTRERLRATLQHSVLRWVVICASAAAIAAASWFGSRVYGERAALRELARIGPALEGALAVRRDLDAADEALRALGSVQDGKWFRARFLARLTPALPDSAFLVALRLESDGSGSLSGYAPRAAAVVAQLERVGLVRNPALEGSTSREVVAGRELERFAIRFRLVPTAQEVRR